MPNIRQLMADLKTQDQSILRCIELLHDTSEQLAESFRHEEECQELLQADADLRELIDAQAEKAIRRRVLEEISQDLQANVHVEDPAKKYKDEVRDRLDAYNKQTSRKKYAKNTDYENFRNTLWVAKEEGPMPTMKDLIPAEDGDENDEEDDDFTMGGETQNFRCPLTANVLEDPLTKYVPSFPFTLPLHFSSFPLLLTHPTLVLCVPFMVESTVRSARTPTAAQQSKNTFDRATTVVQPPVAWLKLANEVLSKIQA